LDEQRLTTVSTVTMPEKAAPTQKLVRESPSVYGHTTGWFLVPAD
jgi:hypothetical protein